MIALAWLSVLAAASSVDLVNEVYRIPPNQWRYVELGLKQRPALVTAGYEVENGSHEVRLALMRRDDLEHLREGLPHGVIDETGTGSLGRLAPHFYGPGDFVVVLDNRGDSATQVHLRISLDFAGRRGPEVTQLSRNRQLAVIAISFAVFFGIVTWSARKLLKGIGR